MTALRNATLELSETAYDHLTGRGDPQQRYRVYRLCECPMCLGAGKIASAVVEGLRCPECRGEGRVLDLVATSGNPEGVGQSIIQNALEGVFLECPLGILDTEGEKNQKWLVSPWLPSPRNISDAGRVLGQRSAQARREREDG